MSNICIGLGKRVIVSEVQGWVVDLAENGPAVGICGFYGRMARAGGTSHMPLCVRGLTALLIVSAADSGPASWRVRSMLRAEIEDDKSLFWQFSVLMGLAIASQ